MYAITKDQNNFFIELLFIFLVKSINARALSNSSLKKRLSKHSFLKKLLEKVIKSICFFIIHF